MKTTIALLSLVFGLCTCVQAQTADTNINPVNIARSLALKPAASYKWFVSSEQLVSNVWTQYYYEFMTRKSDGAITNLVINGTTIVLNKPVFGLPLGDGGMMRNVYAYVSARTKTGAWAGNGNGQKQVVRKGESIIVTMTPPEVVVKIPVDPAFQGEYLDLFIEGATFGYGWGWDDEGNLRVSLPPIQTSYNYILRLRDGTVIGIGVIEPFKDTAVENSAFGVVKNIGNVVQEQFNAPDGYEDWLQLGNLDYDCTVPLPDGSYVKGKVITTDGGSGALYVEVNGSATIYLQKVTESGDMPLIPVTGQSEGDWWTAAYTGPNVGKVVIVIIPTGNQTSGWVSVRRFYGNIGGGGGPKG